MCQHQIEQECEVPLSLEPECLRLRAAEDLLDSELSPLPFYHQGLQMATSWTGTGHFALLFPLMRRLRFQDDINGSAPIPTMQYFCRKSVLSHWIALTGDLVCLIAIEINTSSHLPFVLFI